MMPRAFAIITLAMLIAVDLATAQSSQPATRSRFFSPKQWEDQAAFEQQLNAIPDAKRLRAWHEMLASEPHVAGTDGDQRVIDAIAKSMTDLGLDVQVHEFWALLCEPIDAKLEIVSSREMASESAATQPAQSTPSSPRRGVIALPIREDNLLNDPYSAHPGLSFGWNAYSGSGDVTAGVVYANYGTKEDFEKLKELGVDCTGKIVLARYGGNFRGYKAKYAELAGAVGLIIYTDPDDSGYRKGVTYPEGGWANDTCIQRGSILAHDQTGDPLTPGWAATEDARRLDPAEVGLPRIPVQPIGYRAAQQIMLQMTGRALPEDLIKAWQGGLPCAYRLTGGDELKLRLMVKQERKVKRSANVIATLRGERDDTRVFIGSHHDAWGFGAGDPTSGTMLVMEAARSFAELAKQGLRPQRSIAFACWGAEEFGVIGSTEFCEQYADDLRSSVIAYINLDAATMGPNFSASSDPLLKTLIEEVARDVPQAREPKRSVYEAWKSGKATTTSPATQPATQPAALAQGTPPPSRNVGNLGGGSDHVGFYAHLGIPSCFISAGGAPGTAYHSNYDDLAWYRKTVGEDYEPALMLTRVVNLMAARLTNAPLPPFDPARYAGDIRNHLNTIKERATKRGMTIDLKPLEQAVDALEPVARDAMASLAHALDEAGQDGEDGVAAMVLSQAEVVMPRVVQAWLPRWPEGLPGRDWFRNYYASSDPESGYASWMLPALRGAVERGDATAAASALEQYVQIVRHLRGILSVVDLPGAIEPPSSAPLGSPQ